MSHQAPATAPALQVCSACLCSCKEPLEFGEVDELTNLKVSAWSENLLLSFQLSFVLLLQLYSTVTFTSLVSSVGALVPAFPLLWALCQLHAVGQEWGVLGPRGAAWGGAVPCGSWGSYHAVGK